MNLSAVVWSTRLLKEDMGMKNYTKPEIEVLNFQTESIMLSTFDLTGSSVEGGFTERN